MVNPGYRKRTIFLLVAVLLVRFWFGQTFELSGQEAYLWLQGHGANLSPAYWERGPFVPLLIRVGTLFFGDTELGVRWLAAVICCASGFVLFYMARHWFDARTAFWTVVLFLVVPIFAWKLTFMTEAASGIGLMALAMFAFSNATETNRGYWWLLGGAACGMGLLVAPSYGLWIFGVVLYYAISEDRRQHLRDTWLWSAVMVTIIFMAPLIWWWRGAQVADVARARLLSAWPLTHGFSLNQGFHFVGLEGFYLCPLFFILLVMCLWRMGWRELWLNPHYGLLMCLAVPGLVWQNFAAFFHEPHFELIPALVLPLVLIVGCHLAQVTEGQRSAGWLVKLVIFCALAQTLAGVNPLYFAKPADGGGMQLLRTRSGENMTGFEPVRRQVSWRNLADAVQAMQAEQGATLLITDSPGTASALSFYLPRNPLVYVASRPNELTHFDFWNAYWQNASPNDSALYIARSTNPHHPADPPPLDILHNFASVTAIADPPLPGFDKTWDVWLCQNFVGSEGQASGQESKPMHESDTLPK